MSTNEDPRRKSPTPSGDRFQPEPIKIDIQGPVDPPSSDGNGRHSPASSNGDNAVREKLKKTNLEPSSRPTSAAANHKSDEEMVHSPEASPEKPDEEMDAPSPEPKDGAAPRRTRKRSHDESEENDTSGEEGANKKSRHTHRRHERKRSREVTAADRATARLGGVRTPPTHPEEEELGGIEAQIERAKSPFGSNERKRALGTAERELEPSERETKMTKTEEKEKTEEKSAAAEDTKSEEASEKKDESAATKTLGGGWGNISSKSPFATAGASSKPLFGSGASTPSSSATSTSTAPAGFAQSKFGQLASSSASPFGTLKSAPGASPFAKLGSTGNSPFGSPKLGPVKPIGGVTTGSGAIGFGGSTTKNTNVFGGLKSPSPFGTPVSGTSTFGSGGKIKKAGGDEDKEGEEGSDGPDEDAFEPSVDPAIAEQFKKEQEVTTGEENEINRFKAPMKVYFFDREAKAWKERGRCTVRLNTTKPEDHADEDPYGLAPAPPPPETSDAKESEDQPKEKPKMQARFILRADGTHAVVLNTGFYDGMKFGELNGKEPTGNTAQFLTADGGMWLFKAKPAVVKDLWHQVKVVKDELGYS